MLRYAIKRIVLFLPLLFLLSLVAFVYAHLLPGDPVRAMVGARGSQAFVDQLRSEYGLDRPIYVQYLDWLAKLVQGNLGITFREKASITPYLISRIPATLELAAGAFVVAVVLGVPAGVVAALKKNTFVDYVLSLASLVGFSMPSFWIGTLLLLYVGVRWKILPSQGYIPFQEDPVHNLIYLIMPALSLGLCQAPWIARMARAYVVESLQEPFMTFARAKGLRRWTLFSRYTLRYAICGIAIILAMDVGYLLGGAIVIEELFNWPGIGRVVVRAVMDRDYFVIQAGILVYASLFLIINLGAELLHGWLDPRVQLE
jgi:peptide/nickel transport system permease protein